MKKRMDIIKHINKQLENKNLEKEVRELLISCKEHFEKPVNIFTIENATKLVNILHNLISLGIKIHDQT